MYNWDDPINDALSKPDIVPEKKIQTQKSKVEVKVLTKNGMAIT